MILPAAVEALRALAPWPAGPDGALATVLLACSGGADSTLLALAWLGCPELPRTVAVVPELFCVTPPTRGSISSHW